MSVATQRENNHGASSSIGPAGLVALLRADRERIVAQALTAVVHIQPRHYGSVGTDETRRRLALVYDRVADAAAYRQLGPIVEDARRLAEERYRGGYALAEVQAAFNALEEALWYRVVESLPPEELAEALTLVSSIFGVAKDTLACAYVAAAARASSPSLDVGSLSAGAGSA